MKTTTAIKIIEKELEQLNVSNESAAYAEILNQAKEAAEIMTKNELKKYINELEQCLPAHLFFC